MAKARKVRMTVPAAWQWDPMSVTDAGITIQVWSAGGSMTMTDVVSARKLVATGAYFVGSCIHICETHDRIDAVNRCA